MNTSAKRRFGGNNQNPIKTSGEKIFTARFCNKTGNYLEEHCQSPQNQNPIKTFTHDHAQNGT
jgi:hypothetical protein